MSLNPIGTVVTPWAVVAILVIILALAGVITYQHMSNKALTAQNENLATQFSTAQSINKENFIAIADMDKELKNWKIKAEVQAKAAQEASAIIATAQADRAALTSRLKKVTSKDKILPDCTKLLAMDLTKVCPGAATAIQERAK